MNYPLLEKINSPEELKALDKSEIPALAKEIREYLVELSAERGGHLASNLGVVELTLALHRVFDSPKDKIIFDVGHQSYVHKLITGRRSGFSSLRTPGGLSGFTSRAESEHDPFGAGHSSTSVSAALGFAEAARLRGEQNYSVCVLGDGAYTGGMVHEAINNISSELPFILILNENGMSISLNKGRFASYLSRVRVSRRYRTWKSGTQSFLSKIPLLGKPLKAFASFVKSVVKRVLYDTNYFEELGLYYIGPIDGNDYEGLEAALTSAKELGRAVVLHIKTVKGKGYPPAESSPDGYHSITGANTADTFHAVFSQELTSLAKNNEKIVAITAAMGIGTGLDGFGKEFPDRYFDVGIAEPHALTFAAGLAAAGLSPYVAVYSTFLQRGYDSILHDIALQSLPVRIMIDRAGLALGDGATHHGIFDVAFVSHIPNTSLYAPLSYSSLREELAACENICAPVAIRYSNSPESAETVARFSPYGRAVRIDFDPENPPERLFVTYGRLTDKVTCASELLAARGISTGIIAVEKIKPYDEAVEAIFTLSRNARRILYAEEGIRHGGAAEITLDRLVSLGLDTSRVEYIISAIDDNFAAPQKACDLYDYLGLSPERLAERMAGNEQN